MGKYRKGNDEARTDDGFSVRITEAKKRNKVGNKHREIDRKKGMGNSPQNSQKGSRGKGVEKGSRGNERGRKNENKVDPEKKGRQNVRPD